MSFPPAYPPFGASAGPFVPWPAHLRGRRGIQIGIALLVAAAVSLVATIVVLITTSDSQVDGFQRVRVWAVTGTVHFARGGEYIAYYEAPDVDGSTDAVPLIGIMLVGPDGQRLRVDTPYGNRSDGRITKMTYSRDGHHGIAMYEFAILAPGTYQVQLMPNPRAAADAWVAFGTTVGGTALAGGLLGVLTALLGVAGLAALTAGLVRRRDHARQLRRLGGYGYGMAYPPPPPSAAWVPGTPPPAPSELYGDPVDPNQQPW